ncbi:MAG: fatty acid desaturase [Acidimicrobiales bacterium]
MLITIIVAIAVGLALTQVANVITSVWLHRALSHKALRIREPLTTVFRVMLWMLTGIQPRQWVAVHRRHHAATDTEDDPHSPARLGWVRVQFLNALLYRRVAHDDENTRRYARDIPRTGLDRHLLEKGWLGMGLTVAILILTLGWWAGPLAFAVHVIAYVGLGGCVNALAHTFGRRDHPNSATNLQWLAFLTAGEGLHNNHHAMPTTARFSFRRPQIDPGWHVIVIARALRLAEVRHDTLVGTASR